jgi:hypothetical protein
MGGLAAAIGDPGVRWGLGATLAWHLFWLFVVAVDVGPGPSAAKPAPRIYFLGPVLTDASFNMIIASKPEMSRSVYRPPAGAEEALEPEIETLGRQSPGDLMSVPLGGSAWNALRGVLGGRQPDHELLFREKLPVELVKSPYPISGRLAARGILYLPPAPPAAADRAGAEGPGPGEAAFELEVDAEGRVRRADNVLSSGDPEADLAWKRYFESWQFMPLAEKGGAPETGEVRVP